MTQDDTHKYTMKVSRLTIDKLGIQMYDRVSAVLAELIANCYDADATKVTITLPFGRYLAKRVDGSAPLDLGYEIRIHDNGIGMLSREVNTYYLKVGINRRSDRGETTQTGRMVLGRKGIGKLAPFGICQQIEVLTAGGKPDDKGRFEVSNLILKYNEILSDEDEDYPPDIGTLDGTTRKNSGTTIVLRNFDRRMVPHGEVLHRQISARFGIARNDWQVRIENSEDPHESLTVGDLDIALMDGTKLDVSDRPVSVKGTDEDGNEHVDDQLNVTGWIAYSRTPYKDDSMAGIRVFARGKIVAQTRDFDISSGFTGEYKMRSYVVGEIHADWLDDDEDLIRSDRQGIIWTSEKGEAFQKWGVELLREIAGRSETNVRSQVWTEFLSQSHLQERLQRAHPGDTQMQNAVIRVARFLIRRADREQVRNNQNFVDRVAQMAYALGPHHSLLTTLDEVANTNAIEPVIELFEKAKIVEMYSLGQVASERVEAVGTLERMLRNQSTTESQLQKLIEDAPWIIYPEWTPLTRNNTLGTLRETFEHWYATQYGKEILTSPIESRSRRPDFVMYNHRGRIEIIEIKRPAHALADDEYERAMHYLDAVTRFISDNPDAGRGVSDVRLTIVCDRLNLQNLIYSRQLDMDTNVERRTWTEIFDGTKQAHEDFLETVRTRQGTLPNSFRLTGHEDDDDTS